MGKHHRRAASIKQRTSFLTSALLWTTRRATPIPTHTTAIAMPSSQRPFFLSSFIAAFRPQGPSLQSTATSTPSQQPTKHTTTTAAASHANTPASSPAARSYSTTTHHNQQQPSRPLPIQQQSSRRRGSDSSSEGFRDALGADKWYIGGKTAGGEEKFFKMGVIKRVRSNDRLSLNRLSL